MAGVGIADLPVTAPWNWADIHRCAERYGTQILPADCHAAGADLPRGNTLMTYNGQGRQEAYTLPWSRTVGKPLPRLSISRKDLPIITGTCKLSVELAGPETLALQPIQLIPDLVRGMAGYIIQECPGGGDESFDLGPGVGGYVTTGMERIYDVLARSGEALNAIPYGTVTVERPKTPPQRPGDTDIEVANRILSFARMLWDGEQNPARKSWYWSFADVLELVVEEMSPDRGDVVWWEEGSDTLKSHMQYTCDKTREGPKVVDCAKLQYHGLGHGEVSFREGETKFFRQDTCAVAVSSAKAMALSWDQISTAFDTVLNLCVDGALPSSRSGYALFSSNPSQQLFGRKKKKRRKTRRDATMTGLDALPQGAMINVWNHWNNRTMATAMTGNQDWAWKDALALECIDVERVASSPDHRLPQHEPALPPHTYQHSIQSACSRKRSLEDEVVGDSSDTPLFSSDDLPASSENYAEHRVKRQRRSPWWALQPEGYLTKSGNRTKREFKRNVDSGIWLESETDTDDGFAHMERNDEPQSIEFKTLALRTFEDPEKFDGPIFPYWEDQPADLEAFWRTQESAVERVGSGRVLDSAIYVDINLGLSKLQGFVLNPIPHMIAEHCIVDPETDEETYYPFTPSIYINLSVNKLSQLPGELFCVVNLTMLSLRGNNLEEIPPAIGNLVNLRELNVASNKLQWLPFELRELLSKKLHRFWMHPNPFVQPLPAPAKFELENSRACSTAPARFNVDGTLVRASPPSPCTTPCFSLGSQYSTAKREGNLYPPSNAPSLYELSLRACYKSQQLSQLPFLIPDDASEAVTSALKHTWYLKQQGGQRCAICKASYILPRTEWIEWWKLP
ncbi:MAG: hypothetical protein Q9218_004880, partial [Villophora microphyllina]